MRAGHLFRFVDDYRELLLTYISRINKTSESLKIRKSIFSSILVFMSSQVEHKNSFITWGVDSNV